MSISLMTCVLCPHDGEMHPSGKMGRLSKRLADKSRAHALPDSGRASRAKIVSQDSSIIFSPHWQRHISDSMLTLLSLNCFLRLYAQGVCSWEVLSEEVCQKVQHQSREQRRDLCLHTEERLISYVVQIYHSLFFHHKDICPIACGHPRYGRVDLGGRI
jgi:hypothetical protein